MRVKAAVLREQGLEPPFAVSRPFVIGEVDLEEPGEDEVLVKVLAAGLCHSDLSTVQGQRKRNLPIVGGHEGAGEVIQVGRSVTELRPGDHVVMTAGNGCRNCKACRAGRPALCQQISRVRAEGTLPNGLVRFSENGLKVHHYSAVSSFAQYTVMMPSNLIKIDGDYPIDVAAMFGCAVVTGAGSIFNAAKVRPGDSVAIFGLGGVGLNAVMAGRIAGASRIIGIDINADKFALAKDLGCTHTLLSTDGSLVTKVRELTVGGADFAIEVSGNRAAMEAAIDITRVGAEVVCVGVAQSEARYDYPHTRLVVEEKVIRGSHFGSGRPDHDVPRYLEFFRDGRMPVDRLKSRVIALEDINEALDHLLEGVAVRQIILPHM